MSDFLLSQVTSVCLFLLHSFSPFVGSSTRSLNVITCIVLYASFSCVFSWRRLRTSLLRSIALHCEHLVTEGKLSCSPTELWEVKLNLLVGKSCANRPAKCENLLRQTINVCAVPLTCERHLFYRSAVFVAILFWQVLIAVIGYQVVFSTMASGKIWQLHVPAVLIFIFPIYSSCSTREIASLFISI